MNGVAPTPQSNAGPVVSAGTSVRTVLMEEFTATNCPYCAYAGPAVSRLADENGPNNVVMLGWHIWTSDPYYSGVFSARATWYGVPGIPAVIWDGGGSAANGNLWAVGAGAVASAYDTYKPKLNNELTKTTNIQITLQGDLTPTTAWVTASIYASDPVTEPNLNVRFVLYEDGLYAMGTNGEPFHRDVVRELYSTPLVIAQGQTVVMSHSFTPGVSMDKNRLGIIVFVQSDQRIQWGTEPSYNSPVLQAARWHFVRPNSLLMMDAGTAADYTGSFERPLSSDNRAFEAYNTKDMADTGAIDIKTTPSVTTMEEFGAVIWNTGGQTLDTLNAGERMNIGQYLASPNVGGNVFLQGRAIATDLNSADPTYLGTYFKAAYGGTSSATFVNGNASDPITNAWSATNLAISGTPSDQTDPYPGGTVPITYPGLLNAGVKGNYDLDSGTLYFGVNYFGSADARKNAMMDNILNWLDSIHGPWVSLISPNGGEEYSPGDLVQIKWSAIDVEIPVDGIEIYFTTTLSAPTWQPIATGEPNDGVYYWTVPVVNTNDCGIKIVARDGDLGTPDTEAVSVGACTIGFPDVSITKDVSNPTPQKDEVITYSITLTNAGSLAGYATVTDALPSGVTYVGDDGSSTGVSNYFAGNTTAVWTVMVPPMSNVVWHIQAQVLAGPPGTTVKNWAFFNSTSALGGSPQSGNDEADFQIPAMQNWQIDLPIGKRLVSIPILLSDYRVNIVLASIANRYNYVRQYQASDPANPWKTYEPGRAYNSLTHLRPENGFWIEMKSAATLVLIGARAGSTPISMLQGWNMVGYPSLATGYTVADVKASLGLSNIRFEGFDDKSPPYNLWVLPDNYELKGGEGYWVFVPSAATWNVVG